MCALLVIEGFTLEMKAAPHKSHTQEPLLKNKS